jgi:RimJ/RimL family protein N-acetyltransferase
MAATEHGNPVVDVRRSTPADFESFYECLASVILERRFLALTEAPPLEEARAYIDAARRRGMVQCVAVADSRVVGWCDVIPHHGEQYRHTGRLGMGIVSEYRGQRLGVRLLDDTVKAARDAGLARVELDVFSSNVNAIRLYQRYGFAHEGVRRRARIIDGRVEDIVLMGLLFDE